ncbi:thioredoxin domain-containing protein [candidate division KSB1 bacterium]|nr:thioredoxin domain-containing protein [candidate division KSB1 bacterium]
MGETKTTGQVLNRLQYEKSPYLLQHSGNPVNWYPWCDDAFDKAIQADKPIFLSIGYSTCHWCHVMAHESFEDDEVAKLLNRVFVCIKVDREERPDIDNIYMTSCQMMTGSGGWPLTIFMTPDKKPFYAGTYFPKESRSGRPGLIELVVRTESLWKDKRTELIQSGKEIHAHLKQINNQFAPIRLEMKVFEKAYKHLSQQFDSEHGGFGSAPKFPSPHQLMFLMRYWYRTEDAYAMQMAVKTLEAMQLGGIVDHIGFGFHRYSTDAEWILPHFEKMLYDQALLAIAYLEAYQITKTEAFATTARNIFTYVLRDMSSPEGGFYSAEDADSDGEEGTYYLWTLDELKAVLGHDDAIVAADVFNIRDGGNFKDQATGKRVGRCLLYCNGDDKIHAGSYGMTVTDFQQRLEIIKQKLFKFRKRRIHPDKDDKILADWNGLMIAALAFGGKVLKHAAYTQAAEKAVSFISTRMIKNGRLLHRYRDGDANIDGFVDDFAFLIWGLLELYQTTYNATYLKQSIELSNVLLDTFWDDQHGGFYFTADDTEQLLMRQKEIYDGAIPSGNSVALSNFLKLGRLTGDKKWDDCAEQLIFAFSEKVSKTPAAFTYFLSGLNFHLGETFELVLVGKRTDANSQTVFKKMAESFLPYVAVTFISADEHSDPVLELVPFLNEYKMQDSRLTIYLCRNFECELPTTDVTVLENLIKSI